jgi:hypothetical protein
LKRRAPRRGGTPLSENGARDWLLEDRCLPSSSPVPMPSPPNASGLKQIFWDGGVPLNPASPYQSFQQTPPVKTITITNNSTSDTIYPMLRDANTGIDPSTNKAYDPQDLPGREFRAYIGYQSGTSKYLGLQHGQSITIQIPLVFWDSDNLYITNDSTDLLTPGGPYGYSTSQNTLFYVVGQAPDGDYQTSWVINSAGGNGLIMFYYSPTSVTVAEDAPAQLSEMSIRDNYLTNFGVDPVVAATSYNYDISYVNNLILPIAMEAPQVPIPNTKSKADFGYIGTGDKVDTFQNGISAFTDSTTIPNALLGDYFGGLPWPQYYNPETNPVDIDIPSGYQLFLDGPLNNAASSYDPTRYMLSSGGTLPIFVASNATVTSNTTNSFTLTLNSPPANLFSTLSGWQGEKLTINVESADRQTIYGTVSSFQQSTGTVVVTTGSPLATNFLNTFVFEAPPTDYAASAITNLWYSWVNYYLTQPFNPGMHPGQISTAQDNELDLDSAPSPALSRGMTVSGLGIPNGTIILDIKDGYKIFLSQLPTPMGQQQYTFGTPAAMDFATDPFVKPYPLVFDQADQQNAVAFAAAVYTVMKMEATALNFPTNDLPNPAKLVSTAIGGDFDLPHFDRVTIGSEFRDTLKSILRGVPDYRNSVESNWYPKPYMKTGGQQFNVFNLDPYVWFVHRELGLEAYGFSVDDDQADAQAEGVSDVLMNYGGLQGLPNSNQFFGSLNWGTLNGFATFSNGTGTEAGKTIITLLDPTTYYQITAPTNKVDGAYVTGPAALQIPQGTRIASLSLMPFSFVLNNNVPLAVGIQDFSVNTPFAPLAFLLTFQGDLPTTSVFASAPPPVQTAAPPVITTSPTAPASVSPSPSLAFSPTGPVSLTVFPDGSLVQFDTSGAHLLVPAGVRSASVAFGPFGEVMLVVYQNGSLFQFDVNGTHLLAAGGIQSAGAAFTPSGQFVIDVVFLDGRLVQFDVNGAHQLGTGVNAVSLAFGKFGMVLDVVFQDRRLFQFDPAGTHLLATNASASAVAVTSADTEALDVLFADGSLWEFDATGTHKIAQF